MKRITKIIHCLNGKIKKNIFNRIGDAESMEYGQLFPIDEKEKNGEDLKRENEYFDNYKITTRWQTV